MYQSQVGLFKSAEDFATNLIATLTFYSAVTELVDWMEDVEAGMSDPTLPEDVKAQVLVDYNHIQKHFNQFTGSLPQN